jgi:hypothetical protein
MMLLGRPGLAEAFGRAGRARALERFTGERYLDEYDRLYRELAGPRRVVEDVPDAGGRRPPEHGAASPPG